MDNLFARGGMDIEEGVEDLSLQNRLLKDLLGVLGLHLLIKDLLGMKDDQRALFTEPMAARHPEIDPASLRMFRKNLFKRLNDLMTSRGMTARSCANGNAGLIRIPLLDDLISKLFQCLRGINSFHSKPPFHPMAWLEFLENPLNLDRTHIAKIFPINRQDRPCSANPKQLTVSKSEVSILGRLSRLIPSSMVIWSTIRCAPRTWQAVPRQT